MTVGERIRKIRTEKGMTQKQVAEACGMADSAVRKYESGAQKPKLDTIIRLAKALDVSPSLLAGIDPLIETPENRAIVDCGLSEVMRDSQIFYSSGTRKKARKPTLEEAAAMLKDKPSDEDYLMIAFDRLNEKGRRIAIERVQELGEIAEYRSEGVITDFSQAMMAIHGDKPKLEEGEGNAVNPEDDK